MTPEARFRGDLIRIRSVVDDGAVLHGFLRNGSSVTISPWDDFDVSPGELFFIRSEDGRVYLDEAPEEMWPEDSWIGTVLFKSPDETVLDVNLRLQSVPTVGDIAYSVGNTVEANLTGVTRVVSEESLSARALRVNESADPTSFEADLSGHELDFSDFGGSLKIVERARELIQASLEYREAIQAIGARPIKGVLFTGPPGTGKTHLARILAHQAKASFFEISGPQIFSKWYGESEEVLRKIFDAAASKDRAIIFFDEIDSVAGKRDEGSHEASKRVVAQLLTKMDGFNSSNNVVVIAATNRQQDIDPALTRPGRFDWRIRFELPDEVSRRSILRVSAKRLVVQSPLPFDDVAAKTDGWSAAELSGIWPEAALFAVRDGRQRIASEDMYAGFQRISNQRQQERSITRRLR